MYGVVLIDTQWQLTAVVLHVILLYQFWDAENIHPYFIPIVLHRSLTLNDLPFSSWPVITSIGRLVNQPYYGISHIDGSMQEKRNSIVNTLDLHISSTNPSIWDNMQEMTEIWQSKIQPPFFPVIFQKEFQLFKIPM